MGHADGVGVRIEILTCTRVWPRRV